MSRPAPRESQFWLCYRPWGEGEAAPAQVRMVDQARAATVRDTAVRARQAGFERVRLFTTVPAQFADLTDVEREQTLPSETVGEVVARAAAELREAVSVCYAGSGMPAMPVAEWEAVRWWWRGGWSVANNVYACDWVAAWDGRDFVAVGEEDSDNTFARLLNRQMGQQAESERAQADEADRVRGVERTIWSRLDLDTPADLAMLSLGLETGTVSVGPGLSRPEIVGPGWRRPEGLRPELRRPVRRPLEIGAELGQVLSDWREPLQVAAERLQAVLETITDRRRQLSVIGRTSGEQIRILDRDSACRIGALKEWGLGSRESGRGEPRALIGLLLESLGAERVVAELTRAGAAAVWDTRPVIRREWRVSRADRFAADLGWSGRIRDSRVRELAEAVEAVEDARVALGGHCLVNAGLELGLQTAWERWEQGGAGD